MSDVIELCGLAFIAVAVFLFLGAAACCAAVGVELLVIGLSLDGIKVKFRVEREDRQARPRRPLRRVG